MVIADNSFNFHFDCRYVPGDNPPSQVFNVPWITVDVSFFQIANKKIYFYKLNFLPVM